MTGLYQDIHCVYFVQKYECELQTISTGSLTEHADWPPLLATWKCRVCSPAATVKYWEVVPGATVVISNPSQITEYVRLVADLFSNRTCDVLFASQVRVSHLVPVYPEGQLQTPAMQVPPFLQFTSSHSSVLMHDASTKPNTAIVNKAEIKALLPIK
jgi:hypothetical protein